MGFLRRLIGGPSEREVPTALAIRPYGSWRTTGRRPWKAGWTWCPALAGSRPSASPSIARPWWRSPGGSVTTALSTTRNLIVGSRGHEVCPARELLGSYVSRPRKRGGERCGCRFASLTNRGMTTFTVASNEFLGGGKEKAEYHATWV